MAEIRNPNLQGSGPNSGGSGGGDLRSSLGFAMLLIAVLLGYQLFFHPKQAPVSGPAASQPKAAQQAGAAAAAATGSAAAPQPAAPGAAPAVTAALESDNTVENAVYKIVLTNRGGQIRHWFLKNYSNSTGKPLDLVQPQAAAQFGMPLSLYTYEPALTQQLNQALYQVSVTGAQPSATGLVNAPASVSFRYAAGGLDVLKTVHFDGSYAIGIETQVRRNGQLVRALVEWPSGLGDMDEFLPDAERKGTNLIVPVSASSQFVWSAEGKQDSTGPAAGGFLFWSSRGVSGGETLDEPYSYAAVSDLYFAAAFLPEVPARTTLVTLHNTLEYPADLSKADSPKRPGHVLGLAVGDSSGYTRLRLFAGPKSMDVLTGVHATGDDGKPTGQNLTSLIQFGWLTILAKPLYLGLRFLTEHGVPGWGWAIIVATCAFYLLMLPTRYWMMKSSLKMMRIQPKVEALKARYAHLKMNDPKRAEMNAEMMALYKNENVNMYGSCLPALVQMPLFIAFYRVLANVIELRQAHWFWLHDLSVADPTYVLAGIIIVGMLVVQLITPAPGMDPSQRRMMAIMMPAIFGYSMAHFASGLALYWATGNIINLLIQIAINQSPMGKEMHAIAARRAAKRGGGGSKTIQGKR